MSTPRVAAVHDLSCFGRCALTIVMPTLSVMGVQCCPVPTALLSTHTGGFTGNTFLDLSDEMAAITAHWQSLGLDFQGIYTGFLGSMRQIGLTENLIQAFRREGTVVVIDPVMGDHGRPYRTYTPELCRGVRDLSRLADVVVPNRTEAAILLERDYSEITLEREEDCCRWARALSMEGRRSVVLTGITLEGDRTGAACFDRATSRAEIVTAPHVAGDFHGTGGPLRQRPHRGPGPGDGPDGRRRPGGRVYRPVCPADGGAGLPEAGGRGFRAPFVAPGPGTGGGRESGGGAAERYGERWP